jgi:uncharacterized protein YuzE
VGINSVRSIRLTYDENVNAAYLYLRDVAPGEARSCPVECPGAAGMIVLDIDAEGRLVGIEVLGAKQGLPEEWIS